MSAEDLLRRFCPRLTDEHIDLLLADALYRMALEERRWARRQWRRVDARRGAAPGLSRMRSAYRRRRR